MFDLGKALKMSSAIFLFCFGGFYLMLRLVEHNRYYIYGQWLSHASNAQIDKVLAANGLYEMIFKCSIFMAVAGMVGALSSLMPANRQ
jgi:hypothetical protein